MSYPTAHIVQTFCKTMVVLKRIGIGLQHIMFHIYPFFMQQITIIAVYANKKIMTQVIKIFQTLGHSTGFMTEFIPGACYKMETVVRSEMLQNGTPKDDIIFIFSDPILPGSLNMNSIS